MSKVTPVSTEQFKSVVVDSKLPVIVDFYASWCAPCRRLAPILDRLAEEFAGQIRIVKVDSDAESELATKYRVTGLPTVIFFENGEPIGQFTGLPDEHQLRDELKRWATSFKVTN